jgi:hypothetical protein
MPSKHEERIMAKLTDTQLIVLSNAAARDDGVAVLPAKMNKAVALKVGTSLVARKLMREVRSKGGMPVWRQDQSGRSISLMIARAGREAIGVDEDEAAKQAPSSNGKPAARSPSQGRSNGSESSASTPPPLSATSPRPGSKQALVTGMLSANGGATLDALIKATGWLPHTTRAALTGLRKRGFLIERSRKPGDASLYRIAPPPASNHA